MFEILFLGTSASAPSVYRGLTSSVILAGEHRFLIDCGEGTQRQILRSGIGFKKLTKILVTHSHLDHILGLGGLLSTFVRWEGGINEIEIWGGKPALDRIQALIYDVVLRNEKPPIPIHLIDITKPGKIIETKRFSVTAFPVTHRGHGNWGYVFEEHAHRPFLVEKAEALGVPAGPERGKLVKGDAITLSDGRIITPDMVLGEPIKGTKLAYVGDTARTDNLVEYVQDADTLVIEGTFLDSEATEASLFGHITVKQAAELAIKANVKSLLINHVSRRYRERDMIAEAQGVYPSAYVVRDLDHFMIRRGQTALKKDTEPEIDDLLD
ncbi:MAG: ribonuclease [Phototrophicales bacterium]|nr:MAG: ribonuclease [Phototrophicales bacterium]